MNKLNILGYTILIVAGLVVVSKFYFDNRALEEKNAKILNENAQLQQNIKENETTLSSMSLNEKKLKNDLAKKDSDLAQLIKSRDEQVAALGDVALQWKNKAIQIKNAKQEVVEKDGTTIVQPNEDQKKCLADNRLRVDFDKTQDFLHVHGNTLTNPPEANVNIDFTRPMQLTLVVSKTEEGQLKAYLDTNDSDVVPNNLTLKIDQSMFEKKWYEKIAISGDVALGNQGLMTNVRAVYDIRKNMFFGPMMGMVFDGGNMQKFYGFSAGWYPFMK